MVRDGSKLLESREEVSEGEESSFDEGTWEQGREKGRPILVLQVCAGDVDKCS